jgi:hypothetical protein
LITKRNFAKKKYIYIMVAIANWLMGTECFYHGWPNVFSPCHKFVLAIFFDCDYILDFGLYYIDNTRGVTTGTRTTHPSRAPEFTLSVCLGSCCSYFRFLCSVFQDYVSYKLPCRSSSDPHTTIQRKNHIRHRIRKLSGVCVSPCLFVFLIMVL